jgi:hypothetical protein
MKIEGTGNDNFLLHYYVAFKILVFVVFLYCICYGIGAL